MGAEARRHAARLVEDIPATTREAFAADPFGSLEALGIGVRLVDEPPTRAGCSVAGYLQVGPPPRIHVVRADSTGRQHFSALHEYGHLRVRSDTAIADAFFDKPDGGRQLEEDVCDAVAGALLFPPEHVAAHIGDGGPTAAGLLRLIESTPNASREACCVRAMEQLQGPGHVMIARDGVALVTKSSVPYRVAKNTHQGDDHIVAKAQRAGSWRDESPVIYASGARSDMFFADAVRSDDGYVVAVFAQGSPPWLDGLAIARSFDDEANQAAYCPRCDRDFETMAKPCPKCGDLPHFGPGGCGKCSCGPKVAATTNCNGCGFPRTPAEWTAGGEFCDECMGI